MSSEEDSPHVVAPPPLIYLAGLGVGFFLQWIVPISFMPENLVPIGIIFVVSSILLVIGAIRSFMMAKTNIDIRKPSTNIVATGPYRFSRNPMYLSMALLVAGIAIWVNSLWILIPLIPSLIVIQIGVIAREEKYLTEKFGDEYVQYKTQVHRWI